MATNQIQQEPQQVVNPDPMACDYIAAKRHRYFTGKNLQAQDFTAEQHYHLSRHRLHNRLLHGWGVVCGLRVKAHRERDCKNWVVVRAGVAMDCCGHELVLDRDTAFDLSPYAPLPEPATETSAEDQTGTQQHTAWRLPLVLAVRYREHLIERVPVLYSEDACDPTHREYNRIHEVAELYVYELRNFAEYPNQWPGTEVHNPKYRQSGGGQASAASAEQQQASANAARDRETERCQTCRDDCDDYVPGPAGVCLKPECMIDDCVPLAILWQHQDHERGWMWHIDMLGRRQLNPPPEFLTHIVGHSWTHGGGVSLRQLREWDGVLEVRFDRPIRPKPDDNDGTSINEFTFVVQYYEGGGQFDSEFLPWAEPPYLDKDDPCRAVFRIASSMYEEAAQSSGRGHPRSQSRGMLRPDDRIYIMLKCDFILDCHDQPVDGNYLKGEFPTGDGIPGGIFESWFWIVAEEPSM